MLDVVLKCRCGAVQGVARDVSARSATRAVCYCDDCQAFAYYLGRETAILDEYGGTEVFQMTPAQIGIHRGTEQLRCVRLTAGGMYRWYTACCHTPVANTVSARLPFVAVIHAFMDAAGGRDSHLGPVRFRVQGRHARGTPPYRTVYPGFPVRMLMRVLPRLLLAVLRRQHRPTPFFDATGRPIVTPHVLAA